MNTQEKNILLIIFLMLLLSGTVLARQSGIDKLQLQISKEPNDTCRIKLLIQLGLIYPVSSLEQLKCLKEAYDLSKKKNYRYGLVFGQYYEVLLLSSNGRYDEAIDKCKRCIDQLDSMHIVQLLDGFPLSEIRVLFRSAGKQGEKFRYYTEKAVFYKRHGPIENTADCFHGIAGYYNYLADYDKAIEYYLRAKEVYKSFDPLACANEEQVIGAMYLKWGNLDKAEEYLKSALNDLISLNYVNNYFYCYHQLGDLYFQRHEYTKALQYFFEGRRYCTEPLYQAINLVNCAAVYLQLHSKDNARFYLDSAQKIRQKEKLGISYSNGDLEIDYTFYKYFVATGNEKCAQNSLEAALQEAELLRYLPLVLKYTNELHLYFLQRGDSLRSFRYLLSYKGIQDSLKTKDSQARIATFENEQQSQQKEKEIDQLETQKNTQFHYYLIGSAFLLLIIVGATGRLRYINKTKKILNAAKRKSDELLLHILPYETAEELKALGSSNAKRYEEVTVMFTDFKNFTLLSEKLTAEDLVKMIHFYFSEFDRIISLHNIEKIKIIGDSYMCAGGLPLVNETHALDVVMAAIELQSFIAVQKQERMNRGELYFELRIGIHTGHVVAGIVGTTKFTYDIWGVTVNTASQMENSSESGKVNVSGSTYECIKDHFNCIYRGKVKTKHNGEVDMYFVDKV
jgi:adenylate cyclase